MQSKGDTATKAPRIKGRLADNRELVQRAMDRAEGTSDLEPVKRHLDGEHWIFALPRRQAPAGTAEPDRSPQECKGGAKKERLPILGQDAAEADASQWLCPSFMPRKPGTGQVFGVVVGDPDRPEMIPLEHPEPVTREVFEMVAPFHPSEVFRIASPCVEGSCKNFGAGTCHLAKANARTPQLTDHLPPCAIRSRCLWWHQEGPEACLRCPGVVTNNSRSKALRDELGR